MNPMVPLTEGGLPVWVVLALSLLGLLVGGAAVFLASRASDFVNGQILTIDGGLLAAL